MSQAVRIGKTPRGPDFNYKFKKGEWAEILLLQTLARHPDLRAIQYGISRDDTLYTEAALDAVKEPGVNELKRPDILVFHEDDLENDPREALLVEYHEAHPDDRKEILSKLEDSGIIDHALMAIEAEASRFNLSKRPNSYSSLSAYVKTEDYPRLANWQLQYSTVPMFVCQLFFDCGYIIPFKPIEAHADQYEETGNEPLGFTQETIPNCDDKEAYRIEIDNYPGAIRFGTIVESPRVVKEYDDKKHNVEYTWSRGGKLQPEKKDPHFHEGEFEEEAVTNLARWAFNAK